MANKSIFKKAKKKQIVVCVYLFSWKTQIKQKANQTKQKKKLFTSFKNYSRNQYSKNSDIAADTNHTQKENLQKYSKQNFSIQNYFSPDISKRNLVKSINKNRKLEQLVRRKKKKTKLFLFIIKNLYKKEENNNIHPRFVTRANIGRLVGGRAASNLNEFASQHC